MIYQKYNFNDTFLNASGNKRNRMVLGELGKAIKEHKDAVIGAIQDADISISDNANRREIIKTILNNKRNKRLMSNLGAVIVASSSFDGEYSTFLKKDDTNVGSKTGTTAGGEEKGKFLSQIGDWFKAGKEKRQQKRAQAKAEGKPTFWQRVGGFFNKNKENIGAVAGSLYGGLQNTKEADAIIQQQVEQQRQADEQRAKTQKMIIIGVVVVVAGFFAYKYFNKGNK
jgi:hypothetical protein